MKPQRSIVSRILPQRSVASRNTAVNCGCHLGEQITWTSTPLYDEWGWWGDYWKCNDWMEWHRALKNRFGLNEANRIFITAYHKAGFGAASYDCRTFNPDFIKYAKENGFYSALFIGLAGIIMQPVSNVVNTGSTAVNTVNTAIDTVTDSMKYVKWIALGGLAIFVFNQVKK